MQSQALESLSHAHWLEKRYTEPGVVLPKTLYWDLLLSQLWVSEGSLQRTFLENGLPGMITSGFLGQTIILGLRLVRL